MSFLDRLRPQPRWKHPDPAIRAAAVGELPDDPEHRAIISELAGGDDDVRVRRTAAARVTAVEELVALAGRERDGDLKHELLERLVEIATRAAQTDGDAALALSGIEEQRQLASVARTSPHENVRTAALGRIHDVKALASVARQAADPQTAVEAVARIADVGELTSIALKTEHKEAGIAALERAAEATLPGDMRQLLDSAATRARSKSVSKRARAMIQSLDEAEAARRAALEQWQQRVVSVMARLEALAAAPSSADARRQIGDAESEWRVLAGSAEQPMDDDTNQRFGGLMAQAMAAVERTEREIAERRAEAERQAAIRAVRESICERLEAFRGEDTLDQIEKARAEWEGLPEPGEEAREVEEFRVRFEEACRRARERHQNRERLRQLQSRLAGLAADAERLAGEADFNESAWHSATREWETLRQQADELDQAVDDRYATAGAAVRQREEERRAAAERSLRQHVQRMEQLVERTHKRAGAEDLTLREADRAARELRAAIEAPPPVEPGERHVLVERAEAALAAISPKLHELREMDEWKRFANAAVQEELIARTEALRARYLGAPDAQPAPEDLEKVARQLHEIQERWKQVAEAPRAQAQALWHRYRQAADPIQAKLREFFAHRSEERAANLQRKLALIERAEALADSTDWIKTAEELKKLQAEWQQIGAVPRQDTKATWKRFREACDRFFTRRNADLAQRKEVWSGNLARKEALCARAEELAASREWERAAAEIRRMQADWKTIGPVRRNKSEAIWQRFRAACDTFFERYKRRDEIELEVRQADREGLVAEMEAMASPPGAGAEPPPEGAEVAPEPPARETPGPRPDLLERVRSLRSRWNQTTPVVRQGADPLSARFVTALAAVLAASPEAFRGTELDMDASRQKMEKLCTRVEGFVGEAGAAPANSSKALAEMLREALAANTIGGRAGEEAKWRAMADEVRQAQAAWARLGPVPGEAGRALNERFHRACNRFFEHYRRHVPPGQPHPPARPAGRRPLSRGRSGVRSCNDVSRGQVLQ
ncbi:MAG TPA: DUF349 domain-containing protein [Vicinamibacterales bacterium]|nr:DUF349 domain-containing protein [Vicinamibacterales bacterium]